MDIGENFGSSDHQILRFNIATLSVNETDKNCINYSKGDYVKAKRLAMLIDWKLIISNNVINGWNNFKSFLLDIRNKCVPLTNKKMSKYK